MYSAQFNGLCLTSRPRIRKISDFCAALRFAERNSLDRPWEAKSTPGPDGSNSCCPARLSAGLTILGEAIGSNVPWQGLFRGCAAIATH